jgi:hypothetical protein
MEVNGNFGVSHFGIPWYPKKLVACGDQSVVCGDHNIPYCMAVVNGKIMGVLEDF